MKQNRLVLCLLRISIASVFLYAAVASFLEPMNWVGYLPQFLRHIIPAMLLLNGFSLFELGLAVWLLSGIKTFYAATLAALTLVGIIVANIALIDILFRDIAIFFAALALMAATYPTKGSTLGD